MQSQGCQSRNYTPALLTCQPLLFSRHTPRLLEDTHEEVALKLEHRSLVPSILEEAERYKSLRGLAGFPKVYWYGSHDDCNVLAFELLGPSLEDLYMYCT